MKIIGRKSELRELEQYEKSPKSELICIYGRRRVGKTFLVEQTFGNYFAFRAIGVESGNMRAQLKSFHQRLRECGDDEKSVPQNWFEAFSRLEKILKSSSTALSPHGKKIVFFDEFPWFATIRSDFIEAFGEFWNRCGTAGGDYLFIICGSATSWIIGNILENTGSLYNRVTGQIFLSPFTLKESEQFFKDREFDWSRSQIAECQMVFGGLPYFLDLLNPNESLIQNVESLCFNPNALLRHESKKLLESTLKKSPIYDQILKLLSKYTYGIRKADCREIIGIAYGTFTRAVDELVKCGYVHESKETYEAGHHLRIRLVDPFLLFYYHFLSEDKHINFDRNDGYYLNWRGHAYETLCFYHIKQLKHALGISGVNTSDYAWTGTDENTAQIDLVIDRDDGIVNICEMKYTDIPYSITKEYEEKLLKKLDKFKKVSRTKKALKLTMICSSGIAGVAHTEHISRVITLDDLFEV